MKLLYYAPQSYGGLAEYAHYQANALADLGVEVTLLSGKKFQKGRMERYHAVPILDEIKSPKFLSSYLLRKIYFAFATFRNISKLKKYIKNNGFQFVLFSAYAEYLAPFWAGKLKKLADQGVCFGATIHDPVRDLKIGPDWWHRLSIASAYSFLNHAFVLEDIKLDTVRPMERLVISKLVHGAYTVPRPAKSRKETREDLGIPLDAKVLISFGFIRDNKRLDSIIQAMAELKGVYLICAGSEQNARQKPISFYRNLADELGVSERCRWITRFITDDEIADLFEASDAVSLLYDKTFRSASGVLSLAIPYQKLCIASGGDSSLRSLILKYKLGVWIDPEVDSVAGGIQNIMNDPPLAEWEKYIQENNWSHNAKLVMDKFRIDTR